MWEQLMEAVVQEASKSIGEAVVLFLLGAVFLWMLRSGAAWLGERVIVPLVQRHNSFLDAIERHSKENAENNRSNAETHRQTLERITQIVSMTNTIARGVDNMGRDHVRFHSTQEELQDRLADLIAVLSEMVDQNKELEATDGDSTED